MKEKEKKKEKECYFINWNQMVYHIFCFYLTFPAFKGIDF